MQKPPKKAPPSTRWTSLADWDWEDWGPRLKQFLKTINKLAITAHASTLTGKNFIMSEPFSVGQNWCCLEMVADDETLVIARVQLPSFPEIQTALNRDYRTTCEVATMSYLRQTTDQRFHEYMGWNLWCGMIFFARALVRMAFGLVDGKDFEYINRKDAEMESSIL